jgi:hypothetical protein
MSEVAIPARSGDHLLCERCWTLREPGRIPHRLLRQPWLPCCACGTLTASGIRVRADASSMKCNEEGPVHEDVLGGVA